MKPMNRIVALALSGLALCASAQMEPMGPDHDAAPSAEQGGRGDPQRMKERMERRAKALHDKLNLDADQDKAWKAMEAAMKPAQAHARPTIADMEKLTAPERMEKVIERMKQQQELMTARLHAVKAFYGKLSPEQRKTFDRETLAPWKRLGEHMKEKRGGEGEAGK